MGRTAVVGKGADAGADPQPERRAGRALVVALVGLWLLQLAGPSVAESTERRAAATDLAALLARLEAPSAHERASAEEELAGVLRPSDAQALALFVPGATAEGRARLAGALARRDGHLELVLALQGRGGSVEAVANAALDGLVARFEPGLFAAPLAQALLNLRLDELGQRDASRLGRLDLARPVTEVLVDLARFDALPVRLVADPDLYGSNTVPPAARRVVEGDWRELLAAVAVSHDIRFEAHLVEPEDPRDVPSILFLRAVRSGIEGRANGREVLGRWLAALAVPAEARAAARALGASGWTAAQALLLERWRANGDAAALAGLTWAAELGTAPPSFPTRNDAERLVATAYADIASPIGTERGAIARDVLEALVALPRIDATGRFLLDEPLVPLPGASGTELALARFALELTGRARIAASGVAERLAAWITAPATSVAPRERRLALAAHARCVASAAPKLEDPIGLLGAVTDRDSAFETFWILSASGAPAPVQWREPAAWSGLDGYGRAVGIGWCLARGDADAAGAGLRGAMSGAANGAWPRAEIAEVLELVRRRGDRELVETALASAAIDARDVELLDEIALFAGMLGADRHEALYARAVSRRDLRGHGDPELLGALAAGPSGERARSLLLGELVGAIEGGRADTARRSSVRAGLDRAITALFAANADDLARQFTNSVRALARERLGDPLAIGLLGDWPRPTGWFADVLAREGPIR